MIRRLITAGAMLWLLIGVAAAGLWVGCRNGREFGTYRVYPDQSYGVAAERAGFIAFLQRERGGYRDNDPDDALWAHAGFRYIRQTSAGLRRWNVVLPYWAIIALASVLPAASLARRLTRAPVAPGVCSNCGYDLRASTDRCPECGTPIKLDVAAGGQTPAGGQA
jgi:hypothetical protein